MFRKIESYVTPIILSHVDKYVKNFKSEDTQVSLWSGAVVLHNMELKPNVLQDEFNLPFYLSSGYIHELIIQVPWMKIMSEPILITINTIECVLTLKTDSSSEARNSDKNRNKQETPPGYVQSLVNRIVNNISFRCNNLILKYVEEDIVLSLNIKHLYLDSVNGNWEPTFTDMTVEDLHVRKLVTLSDLTLCLDKRNAAGKIETFLEPLLYRCELKMKLDSAYPGLLQKVPLYVRCHVSSPKIEISISHQQIPMIIRLGALFWALKKKYLRIVVNPDCNPASSLATSLTTEQPEDVLVNFEDTWTGWALSFMAPIYSEDEETDSKNSDPAFLFGIDLKKVSITLKISETTPNSNAIISNKKFKQVSTAKLLLSSVLIESSSCLQRFKFRGGFKKIALYPENSCVCGIMDGPLSKNQQGSTKFLESTTEIEDGDNKFWPVEYENISSDIEMNDFKMLEICPAFAIEYTYILTLPEDFDDHHSEISTDLEYSNFKESAVLNMVCGPMQWILSAGLLHRIHMIKLASDMYDYPPYYTIKALLKKSDLPPPTTDDYEAFMEQIPVFSIKFVAMNPKFIVPVWDHPDVPEKVPVSSKSSATQRKISPTSSESVLSYYKSLQKIPHLQFDIHRVEITCIKPMYPIRTTYVVCQLPEAPSHMYNACHKFLELIFNNLRCCLSQKSNELSGLRESDSAFGKNKNLAVPILNDCSFRITMKKLIYPQYWFEINPIIKDYTLNIGNISICATIPKFMAAYYILRGAISKNHKCSQINELLSTSILQDILIEDLVHMELAIEGLTMKKLKLLDTRTYSLSVDNVKAFAIKSNNDFTSGETVWVLCAPENQRGPFLVFIFQQSGGHFHASFITAKIEESSFVWDPLLYQLFSYNCFCKASSSTTLAKEKSPTPKRTSSDRTQKHSLDESIVHQSSKASYKFASLQSQSDREKDFVHSIQAPVIEDKKNVDSSQVSHTNEFDDSVKLSDKIARFIYSHQKLAICIEIEPIFLYFPTKTMPAANSQTVHDAVKASVLSNHNISDTVLVVRLSKTVLKSSLLKKHLLPFCMLNSPSNIPLSVWDRESTSYPWQISSSNLSISTLSKGDNDTIESRDLLKPVVSNIVISVSAKLASENFRGYFVCVGNEKKVCGCIPSNVSPCCAKNQFVFSKFSHKVTADNMTSLAIVVHIDVDRVILSINKDQIFTLCLLAHGLNELYNSYEEKNLSQPCKKPDGENIHDELSEEYCTSDTLSGTNITKSKKVVSFADSGINESTKRKEACHKKDIVLLTSWVQLTISGFTIKCYASDYECSSPTKIPFHNYKLMLDFEDIMTTLDMHPEYVKLKFKMLTAHMKYFKRNCHEKVWIAGEHNGTLLRGRENDGPLTQNEETSFIFAILTFAKSSSVHNKWTESGKTILKKFDENSGKFIWEIEITMQSLDIMLTPKGLKPFLMALSPAFRHIDCDKQKKVELKALNSTSIFTRPKMWNSAIFPLCYFESRQIRFLMPVENKRAIINVCQHDVFVIQIQKLSILPAAENPLCRQTIRPDLYEEAARSGWLGLPGGPLEDRQVQLSMKGISMFTSQWCNISHIQEPDDGACNENPALRWNNLTASGSLNLDYYLSILKSVDIYIVVALSMYYKNTLVSGPTIDIGLMTDIELQLTLSQIKLISSLYYEFKKTIELVQRTIDVRDADLYNDTRHCPFNHLNEKKRVTLNIIAQVKDIGDLALSDTSVREKTSSILKSPESSSHFGFDLKTEPSREKKIVYLDVICTLGKITVMFNEDSLALKEDKSARDSLLLYLMIHQPNCFISIRQNTMTAQASIFSAQMYLGGNALFPLHILETKPGMPDPSTGIPPPLFAAKFEKYSASKSTLKIDVSCPMMFSISKNKLDRMKLIFEAFTHSIFSEDILNKTESQYSIIIEPDKHHDLWNFHNLFGSLTSVEISFVQTLLNLEQSDMLKSTLSFASFNLYCNVNSRIEKIIAVGLLDSFVLTLNDKRNRIHKMIINPWTIGLETTTSWEPWRDLKTAKPIFQIFLDSDILIVNLGTKEMQVLQETIEYWTKLVKTKTKPNMDKRHSKIYKSQEIWSHASLNDQYYKDDLRAGAFKYVNCNNDTVPLPYQVVIGQRQICWCYPHPRALTRLHSYPLPFQLEAGVKVTDTVVCLLQYYSEVTHEFMLYTRFVIQQDQAIQLDLAINDQYMQLASVWKIEMRLPSEVDRASIAVEPIYFDKSRFLKPTATKVKQPIIRCDSDSAPLPVSPKMLPGCLRVDSYSPPHALPAIQFAMKLPQFDVNFYNSYNHMSACVFADVEKLFKLDGTLPPPHIFARFRMEHSIIEGSIWNNNTGVLNFNTNIFIDGLNNDDFSFSRALWCDKTLGIFWWGGKKKLRIHKKGAPVSALAAKTQESPVNGISLQIGKVGIKIGSHLINTILVASKNTDPKVCSKCQGILPIEDLVHRYVIKNDTCVALRISQEGTNETVLLRPRMATLFQWHYHKKPHLLTFAAHDGDWQTSKGFQIDKCGIQKCELIGEPGLPSLGAVIYVDSLGPCHRSVTLSGCITIFNFLNEKIEFKLYQRKSDSKPMVSPIFVLDGNCQHPSLFADTTCESAFRLHFAGSAAGWTGDVPLKPCPKGTLPWLVKVPIKSEIQFICLWSRVISDPDTNRIIVILSPLYMIRSHFPKSLNVTFNSEGKKKSSEFSVIGKGQSQPLKLPGTTDTKHTINFGKRTTGGDTDLSVSFTYDRELSNGKCASYPDFDASLANLKAWLKPHKHWPFVGIDYDGLKWTPLSPLIPEEVLVTFNYQEDSIDSVLIEINPWTYFYNHSEYMLNINDMDKHDVMCSLEHQCISTPPMSKLNPYFYASVVVDGFHYFSPKLSISTETSEPQDENVIIINITKSFTIVCFDAIAVFSVCHEIVNSINLFKFATSYVALNRTKYDIVLIPFAVQLDPEKHSTKYELPKTLPKEYIIVPRNEKCLIGKSITFFNVLPELEKPNYNILSESDSETSNDKKIMLEKDFAFFIWLSVNGKMQVESFGCPIRIDHYTSRRCISLKHGKISVPISINCKRESEQIYVAITDDSSPQFIIQNNTDVCIAVGHSVINFTSEGEIEEIIEESDIFEWCHLIDAGLQSYYTMPKLAKYFPELSQEPSKDVTHLAFALGSNKNDEAWDGKYFWSSSVNVSITSSEQCVKLPGYSKDIKVSIVYHVHSTVITLDNISQIDISAGQIRSRISDQITPCDSYEITNIELWNQSYYNLVVRPRLLRSIDNATASEIPEYLEDSNTTLLSLAEPLSDLEEHTIYSSSLLEFVSKVATLIKIHSLTVTLFANDRKTQRDVSYLSCDDVVFTISPGTNRTNMVLTVENLQLDNPLFSSGDYDFPVVIIRQCPDSVAINKRNSENKHGSYQSRNRYNMESNAEIIEKQCESYSLIVLKLELEIWNQENVTKSAIGEVVIFVKPLSAYIEDTYMTELVKYVSEFGPWDDDSLCCCRRRSADYFDSHLNTRIPSDVMSEMLALSRPIQMESLRIHPINVVLSLHANYMVYIALDHSPLQFSMFEKCNVLTTSYRLGHALTMHYFSEAIYRAGWVVGSLEILGAPGGLARHVGAGLKAFVAEPCRGLLGRGPWGFIVGMTHGSAVLFKHITQGTAESVSMVASNVARNLDRLSFDTEHVRRTEAARKTRPRGLPEGLACGFKALAIGVVSGASSLMSSPPSITRGILGVVTKPLSATADLVAFTTQGLLGQVGWDALPEALPIYVENCDPWASEWLEWNIRLGQNFLSKEYVFYSCKGKHKDTGNDVALVITTKWFLLIDLEREKVQQIIDISTISIVGSEDNDLYFTTNKPSTHEDPQEGISKARVAAYVGQIFKPKTSVENLIRITVEPSDVSYIVSIMSLAKYNSQNLGFKIIKIDK